jgi:hypothetical protein
MSSTKKRIATYLSDEEYEQMVASAQKAGLSLSKFVKCVCTGQTIHSTADQQAVVELFKARADLGRLGGLFKMALSNGLGNTEELRPILREIEQSQKQVARQVDKVAQEFSRNRRNGK